VSHALEGRALAVATALVVACGHPRAPQAGGGTGSAWSRHELVATAVHVGSRCGSGSEAGARFIAAKEEYRAVLHRLGATVLSAQPTEPPAIDFEREGLLLVEMGRRPTAGYALGLADQHVTVEDGVATLRVEWREPPRGSIQAQVITAPCLLARLARRGIREVRVVDESGVVRATTLVPAPRNAE
jgi:hypothetical protein